MQSRPVASALQLPLQGRQHVLLQPEPPAAAGARSASQPARNAFTGQGWQGDLWERVEASTGIEPVYTDLQWNADR